VGWSDSDRLRTSADQQTMAPRGASEQVGEARTSGRKTGKVSYDWNGGAEGALPDVDRPEPVVERALVGMRGLLGYIAQATRSMGRVMPTSDGDTRPMARRLSRADGVAGGGLPWAYKRDRTRPMAEPVMLRRTLGTAVTDTNLLGPQEGSLALPRMRR
jgi:hypothetical protein